MPDAVAPFTRLGIVGVGLIGGSVGLAARRAWPGTVRVGVDRPDALTDALALGCVDETADGLDDLEACDLIVLAGPVPVILEQLVAGGWPAGAIITDTGSTKRQIVAAGRARPTFVGGHPLAGGEGGGARHASADLFEGRRWILTPDAGTSPEAVAVVEAFVQGLGAAPVRMKADVHDRVMAYVSHLPQVLSVALMQAATASGALDHGVVGPAFQDMTRIAGSPADLWRGILSSNADYVAEAVAAVRGFLPAGGEEFDLETVIAGLVALEASGPGRDRGRD